MKYRADFKCCYLHNYFNKVTFHLIEHHGEIIDITDTFNKLNMLNIKLQIWISGIDYTNIVARTEMILDRFKSGTYPLKKEMEWLNIIHKKYIKNKA